MKKELLEKGFDAAFAAYCDHTVLRAYTKSEAVKEFCEEAKKYKPASVCVNPVHVALVHSLLKDTGIKTATVIGFPLGANKTSVKAFEAAEAVKDGADEVDMVLNVGAMREGNTELVLADIEAVVKAAAPAAVKVIIETCYLTDEEKVAACELCVKGGAKFVKTSTGMSPGGATVHDVALLAKAADGRILVKASGGVDDRATAYAMLMAGADRLGVSKVPQIVEDDTSLVTASKRNQPPKV